VAAGDLGHVPHGHLPSLGAEEDSAADVVERGQLVARAHEVARLGLVQAAPYLVDALAQNSAGDLVDAEADERQAALVDPHLDLLLLAAVDPDRGHPLHGLQVLLDQLLGRPAQLHRAAAALEVEAHDRVARRVETQEQRPAGVARQGDEVELLPHVEGGEVHVASPAELQHHLRQAGAGDRRQAADPARDPHQLLDRARDERLHLGRGGAGQPGLHRQAGVGDVRHQVDRET
jgi:hypothetical protein